MSSFTTRAHDTAKIRAHKRHLDGNSAPTSAQTFAAATYQAGFRRVRPRVLHVRLPHR